MDIKLKFNDIYDSVNIAELLTEEELGFIAKKVISEYEDDEDSRSEWLKTYEKIMEIANQKVDANKSNDGSTNNGSNVKMPVITTAALQFAARSYPEFVRNGRVMNALILGRDDNLLKKEKAVRVTDFMNYQLLVEDSQWEESFDRMLHVYPLCGLVYKKVYYNPITKKNCSEFCKPDQIVVHNGIKNLQTARRITHVIPTHYNTIVEKINYGIYSDVKNKLLTKNSASTNERDYDRPLTELEQIRYLDLDGDGYEEPYIVTVEKETKLVLRIYRCFDMDGVEIDENFKIKRIIRDEYYVDYHFIHAPDGSFHSIGFGQLLLPLNHAINTLINELIDAGSLANLPGGFISKDFRAKKGSLEFVKGEFKQLEMRGEDIAKSIYKMPFDEPSPTLFQLLGLMIQQAKELSSVTDMLQGNQKGQNMPATTSLTLVEQGLKVFNSLQKRTHRSLKQELNLLFRLNSKYLDPVLYYTVNDDQKAIAKEDFDLKALDIIPVSDPSMSSDAQRIARAQAIKELIPMLPQKGAVEAIRNYLDALNTPAGQIAALLPTPDPNEPPPPEVQKIMAETITEQMKPQLDQIEMEIKNKEAEARKIESQAKLILAEAELTRAKSQAELFEAQAIAALASVDDTKKIKILDSIINAMSQKEGGLSENSLNRLLRAVNLDVSLNEEKENEGEDLDNRGGVQPMETGPGDEMAPTGNPEDTGQPIEGDILPIPGGEPSTTNG
jgi:chaperonin GroES